MTQPKTRPRDDLIDSVRAFALAGVILVNMLTLSGLAYLTPESRSATLGPVDLAAWGLLSALLEDKALAAFSFLFGFSFALSLARVGKSGTPDTAILLRRMAVLWAIGLFNAVFLFWADILMTYAALGLILPLAARLPVRVIAGTGAALILAGPLVLILSGSAPPGPVPEGLEESIAAYASPSFADTVGRNVEMVTTAPAEAGSLMLLRLCVLSGMFLLGLAAGRGGLMERFSGPSAVQLGLGAGLLALGLCLQSAKGLTAAPTGLWLYLHLDMVAMALGYLILAKAALQQARATRLRQVLAPLGRMSLTGYLMSAALGQAVFYGWGFALIGQLGVLQTMAVALIIYGALLAFAHLWFHRCLYGPWEWLWRSITKLRAQPLLRTSPAI